MLSWKYSDCSRAQCDYLAASFESELLHVSRALPPKIESFRLIAFSFEMKILSFLLRASINLYIIFLRFSTKTTYHPARISYRLLISL